MTPTLASTLPAHAHTMKHALPDALENRLIVDSVHSRLFGDVETTTQIGKYTILRRIGGGAMAEVYLGWHRDLERCDAIKLVHPAAEGSEVERRRLLREAQAIALLSHDNVVRVHDSGTHGDRVYIAMEYVKGTTLAKWQKDRPWREVLAVYVKAGRGLEAAHAVTLDAGEHPTSTPTPADGRRGLVHRDFKPDNVLIGDDGRVRVADFGLAVPIERAGDTAVDRPTVRPLDLRLTATRGCMGTPLYISPEQLAGDPASGRSDQFSFCVALYEALYHNHPYAPNVDAGTNARPTESGGEALTAPPLLALFDAILHAPLRPPPRGPIPRRIFTILARGLDRDPGARYPSMTALLADLERDPKRTLIWGIGGAVTAGLALGLSLNLGLAARDLPQICEHVAQEAAKLWDGARQGEVRTAFTATGVPFAENSFATVEREISDYLATWTRARVQSCDNTYVHASQDEALFQRSMACLDQRKSRADAAIRALVAVDPATIAGAVDRLRELPRPEDCDDRVLLLQACTLEPDDSASRQVRDAIAAARDAEQSGRALEAEPLAAAAVHAAEAHAVASLRAEASFVHGRLLAALSRPEQARDALLAALDAAEGAGCEALAAEVGTWIAKIVALDPNLDPQLGADWSRYSFAKLGRLADDRARRAAALGDRGLLHERRIHDPAAAEHDYRAALELLEQDPGHTLAARAVTHLNLGSVLRAQGRLDEARAALTTSLDLHRAAYGEGHPNLWKPLFNLGVVATEAGRFADAERDLHDALSLASSAFGPDNRKVLEAHAALAALHLDADEPRRTRKQLEAPLALCADKFPAADPLCLDLRRLLAHSLESLGESVAALDVREQVLGATPIADPRRGEAHVELAASLVQLRRWQPALEHADAAIAAIAVTDPAAADANLYRGEALLGLNRPGPAVDTLERALSFWPDGPDDARARASWALARALCAAGPDAPRSRGLARAARAFYAAAEPDDPEATTLRTDIDTWLTRPCKSP